MPSDRKDQNTGNWPDEINPFVIFCRYADEQVSTALQSITGLPSTVTTPHKDRWEIFANDNGYENRRALQRTSQSSDKDSRHDSGGGDGNHENYPKRWYSGPSDIFGLDSFLIPLTSHLIRSSHSLFPDMFEDIESSTWPVGYIMFSPYSPLHLERQAQYRAQCKRKDGVFSSIMSSLHRESDRGVDVSEPRWREAFEDLLRLENGKPMLNRDIPTKSESGNDWLQGLLKRGSLGDRWKSVPSPAGHAWPGITLSGATDQEQQPNNPRSLSDKDTKDEKGNTELDLYEQFLSEIERLERESFRGVSESPLLRLLLAERKHQQDEMEKHSRTLPMADEPSDDNQSRMDLISEEKKSLVSETTQHPTETQPEPGSGTQSRVVSTITKTERVQLPDGSIQSTIVKTKRFADGREETNSSVETSHPQPDTSDSAQTRNSWFWKD